jgi:hypothetical protein
MPAVGPVLGTLILQKFNSKVGQLGNFAGPLSTPGAAHTTAFCMAIGNGIALGAPTIPFTTTDSGVAGAPPIPGVGSGVGIKVDAAWFKKDLYENIRQKVIAKYGQTMAVPYPPAGPDDAGKFLEALCDSIADSVKEHFATAWILTSAHPIVYLGSGTISEGHFSGVAPTAVSGAITGAGALYFTKGFGPDLAKAIGESYSKAIMQHSTGNVTITGVCVPSPTQICGLPIPGTGTGTAA